MGELAPLLISQGVGAAAGAANTYGQAQAARGQQSYSNAMTQVNSGWNAMDQRNVLARGDIAGSRARAGYNQLAGQQRAAFAGNGVDVNSGSAAAVQSETRALGEIERMQIQQQAYAQALGLKSENLAAVGQNRMRQIATKNAINQSYASAAMNVGQAGVRAAYYADRYQGVGGPKPEDDLIVRPPAGKNMSNVRER